MNHTLKRPKFDGGEVQRIVKKLYGVDGIAKELPSYLDQNFYLKTSNGDEHIFKISSTLEKREILDFQNQAMIHLSTVIPNIAPRVIPTTNNDLIGRYQKEEEYYFVRLLTYLPGTVLALISPHHDELLVKFGHFIGELTQGLAKFTLPSSDRKFHWDLKHAHTMLRKYKEYIQYPEKRALVEHFLEIFELDVQPRISLLRTSVIHNDANNFNVIVNLRPTPFSYDFSIIDFGDIVTSCTIFELAIAIAYLILGKKDPITVAAKAVTGFHSVFPLTALELEMLFAFICIRLCQSVSISAYQQKIDPDNEYLTISEDLAWNSLFQLRAIHPEFAHISFRIACGMDTSLKKKRAIQWLSRNQHTPILEYDFSIQPHVVFDLSVSSLDFNSFDELQNKDKLQHIIYRRMKETHAMIGVGRHNEARLYYTKGHPDLDDQPTVHLGLDLFLIHRIPVYVPMDGHIYWKEESSQHKTESSSVLILEHIVNEGELKFFTVYRNLENDSIKRLTKGDKVKRGERLGYVGNLKDDIPLAFLHFQLTTSLLGNPSDFPCVIPADQRDVWLSVCLDPNLLLHIPDESFPENSLTTEQVRVERKKRIGRSLGVSYQKPLHFVRGYNQYLFDIDAHVYLDGRNNVPHVGHNHPKVVSALQRQSVVLNTNTRYLHTNLVRYAQQLCETLPDPLQICFFVNSGSEANELALRLARTYTQQQDLIVVDHAYHGNTSELVNISPHKFDGPGGQGPPPYVHKVNMPDNYRGQFTALDLDAGRKYAHEIGQILLRLQAEGKRIAGFICESLPGLAGQIVLPEGYLEEVYRQIKDFKGVCIADEVQVGFGRVGTHFWGFELQNVVPDIVTMGKPMGNGHPLGAVVTTLEIAKAFDNGMEFFSTTGGNPVSCAVGLAVLNVIKEEGLQQNALKIGQYLKEGLLLLKEKFVIFGDVRGVGLFLGIELVLDRETLEPAPQKGRYIIERMKEEGILLSIGGPLFNVINIKPPLVFTRENADFLLQKLGQILTEDFVQINR